MDNMGSHEEDTILSLSLGSSCVPPAIRTPRRRPRNPILSLDASLALSASDDVVVYSSVPTTPKAPPSSSHSSVSTFSPTACGVKREKDECAGEEVEAERGSSSRASDEDDEEDGNVRKKLRLTKEQSALLEERFREHSTLNPKQKQALAKRLNLRPRQVEVWFQNRRARTKLKQTEADCELLRRCCETLTDENRRLQKEVNELRAMKYAAAPLFVQLPAAAATSLTMCPSCERVTGTGVGEAGAKGGAGAGAGPPFGVGAPKAHFFNPFPRSAAC
ncbi:homeobox-leucine zipper protein HOX19-like isoform X1 [Iris pallida]|uniref:Homeobox-leucine zipper protein HOX19-like isoform X1 n=1 Tax=Iris pallida TaxID=29817 RepID=A0AAX6GFV5_IRIPA|nr:homeobox-leucine zipper protein HOX19-like isoform X1 [Iris pallida]KAJ6827167.1 homeobox-leucine zipper protein HOX19-like isoform X1 [Iris pallida]